MQRHSECSVEGSFILILLDVYVVEYATIDAWVICV